MQRQDFARKRLFFSRRRAYQFLDIRADMWLNRFFWYRISFVRFFEVLRMKYLSPAHPLFFLSGGSESWLSR
jgi:hypothetical protein